MLLKMNGSCLNSMPVIPYIIALHRLLQQAVLTAWLSHDREISLLSPRYGTDALLRALPGCTRRLAGLRLCAAID